MLGVHASIDGCSDTSGGGRGGVAGDFQGEGGGARGWSGSKLRPSFSLEQLTSGVKPFIQVCCVTHPCV